MSLIQARNAPPSSKLSDAQTQEFEKLWPIAKEKLEARFIAGEITKKKLKNKLFFARLRILEEVKGVKKSIIKPAPLPSLLPDVVDGQLVMPGPSTHKAYVPKYKPFRAATEGKTQFSKNEKPMPADDEEEEEVPLSDKADE